MKCSDVKSVRTMADVKNSMTQASINSPCLIDNEQHLGKDTSTVSLIKTKKTVDL